MLRVLSTELSDAVTTTVSPSFLLIVIVSVTTGGTASPSGVGTAAGAEKTTSPRGHGEVA